MSSILIIDDEIDILNILKYNLEKEGFIVNTATDGVLGIELAKVTKPDLIILDVMMPRMDGIQVCEHLRSLSEFENTLICFLTARGEDFSQIAGLDAGADDYISKPVKPRLLVSKINALLRRKSLNNPAESSDDELDLIIDREKYMIFKKGEPIHLPKKEFELLSLLSSKPDYVFERDIILASVWGSDIVVGDRTIDVHIRKLREKIGSDYIRTVKGVGYKFTLQVGKF